MNETKLYKFKIR